MGAKVVGVHRADATKPDYADEVYLTRDLDALLPQADIVAVTLPGTEATRNLLDREFTAEELPLSDWEQVLEVNLTAPFKLCQLAGREMLKTGYEKIINMASMQSFFGGFTLSAYASPRVRT